MSTSIRVKAIVDTSDIKEANRAMANFATNIRRTAEVGLAFAEAFGYSLDTVLRLAIETGLRTIEFIAAAFAVESVATLGISGALRLGAQAGAIALMMAQISALLRQKNENSRRLGAATTALRIMTFNFIPIYLRSQPTRDQLIAFVFGALMVILK
ncbi:MAG: hypothetical protein IH840_00055 [Candidatus Heimdallarchaeota archaeon]|nr:hypothetical protein [Candidatus Heimdallarchaeota archaeon]